MRTLSRLFLLAALFGLPLLASAQFGDRPRLDDKNLPKDAEPLPELPKADPKSEMKALFRIGPWTPKAAIRFPSA